MADTLESTGNYIPKDLQITSQPDSVDKDKFKVVATGLKIDETYAFQFQYVYPDGTLSEWSPGYTLNTSTELVPGAPSATVSSTGSGVIPVTLASFPANAKRVDVVIIGGVYGTGKVAYSFFAAGTHNIPVAAGEYNVVLLTVTPSSINGDPTSTFSITVTDPTANLQVDPSVTPSTPTVSPVLGAIQLAWNGKTSTGGDQPNGFVAAKVYVGTTSEFTPIDTGTAGANQVDVLNFANGQNTLNIAVGTVVNGVAMDYGIDYYIKIKTTNGNALQDSSPVLASGSPVKIGQVGDGDIIEVKFDKLRTGTLTSQVLTVGAATGKHVKLSGSGDPLTIYGTGGTSDPLLSFSTNGAGDSVLTIKGDGSFSGDISAATGTLTNALNIGAYDLVTWGGRGYPFSVNSSGNIEAGSGKIGGWTINTTQLISTAVSGGQIALYPTTASGGKIALLQNGVEKITIDPTEGIVGPNNGNTFRLTPSGQLTLSGSITVTGGQLQTDLSTINSNVSTAQSTADDAKNTADSAAATASTANTTANSALSAVQNKLNKSAATITDVNNNVTAINANGIQLFATGTSGDTSQTSVPTSGNRIIMNYEGIQAYDSLGPSFQLLANGGTATFRGSIESGSTITGATFSTTSGSKTININNNATIDITSTSTDFSGGGAVVINSKLNVFPYGVEDISSTLGASYIGLSRSGGTPNASYSGWISIADELSGVSRGTLLIQSGGGSNIALQTGLSDGFIDMQNRVRLTQGFNGRIWTESGSSIASYSFRNIGAGSTGMPGASEGVTGDIWIQFA